MAIDRSRHDLKNAILFLETFPEILRQALTSQETGEFRELMELYQTKLQVVKASLEQAGRLQ